MCRYLLISFIFSIPIHTLSAQDVLWAHKLLEVSSERSAPIHLTAIQGNAYKAVEALHEPNIFPGTEGGARAWSPKRPNKVDFIKVGFEKAIHAEQLVISETLNGTAVWKVFLYDERGREHFVHEFNPRPIPLKTRLIDLYFERTPYRVSAVKIVINGTAVPGYNGIDAIGISTSKDPIKVDLPTADGIFSGLVARKLDDNINSAYKDLKPLLSVDNNTLYFSRVRHPENVGAGDDLEDIWISSKDAQGNWQKAVNYGRKLNNSGPNFISSISPVKNGQLLLLGNRYHKKRMLPGVSKTYDLDSGLTEIEPLMIENEENYSPYANFFMGPNQDILLMSVQRRFSEGGRDLYVSFLKNNGKWSTPKNLGAVVNTPEEDFAPYLALDGRTLYFSSKGHLGFGGSDVYVTRRLDDSWTNWTEPENLGQNVNSELDDMFFILSTDYKYAYYTKGDGEDADIYFLELPAYQLPEPVVSVKVRVLDQTNEQPVPTASITATIVSNEEEVLRQNSDGTGEFSFVLPNGKKYELKAQAEDYLTVENDILDLENVYESDTLHYNLYLTPIEKGTRIPLDNIYFEFDKAVLKPESFPQLDKVYEFLDSNPSVEIQLDGHTCSMGSDTYNQSLSERRALAVREYLLNKGSKHKKVASKGFGESRPISSNETETGRQQNRRVEFIITKE